ncbi:MAG: nucleotidyltransferase family protein [Patescibacteria group bacterium]
MNKNNFGIKKIWIDKLYKIFTQYPEIEEVYIFGSRARGDNDIRSDIDLALELDNDRIFASILADIEESSILLKVDLVDIATVTNKTLLENIEKDKILFWSKKIITLYNL